MINDTIVALSSPAGTSALAVVRISGPEVSQLLITLFKNSSPTSNMMTYGNCFSHSGAILDSLMYVYLEGPKTFTGEDSLELFPHGNMLIVKSIIEELTSFENVRLAEPGEFTRRAFEHGKIDLVQAESIGDLIHAKSQAGIDNAKKLLTGKLSSKIHTLVDSVIHLSAKMELDVDFAEEEADPDVDSWTLDLENILTVINGLKLGYDKSIAANQKPSIVFYGKPNAGKSSLINALLDENRLLVSNKPGTTRDYIETQLFLPKGEVSLIDTAGLGVAVDELDAESQEKTMSIINKAQYKVCIIDGCSKNSADLIKTNSDANIIVATKCDLTAFIPSDETIPISSPNNEGIEMLKTAISNLVFAESEVNEEGWMASERQLSSLKNAENSIQQTLHQLGIDPSPELLAFELRQARQHMEAITGVISTDDILNSIFSSFCIGK
ncbi:MAG: tRNA uridine-5-carboxymethylaminomethyl(34) synthesis GTPase MnmE [Reichenbachiella sp.]